MKAFKATLENCQVLPPQTVKDGEAIVLKSEVMYFGGKVQVINPKKVEGQFASLTFEMDVEPEAVAWRSRDGRSGSFVGVKVRFGSIVEASPLKK